ncbi:hypothetical protein ASQ49_02510 [Acidipropionibacterium acidipropionici]|nr:hypothetical protein ASQ49_02510 [Acidipropionibacterium acidipropionici]
MTITPATRPSTTAITGDVSSAVELLAPEDTAGSGLAEDGAAFSTTVNVGVPSPCTACGSSVEPLATRAWA